MMKIAQYNDALALILLAAIVGLWVAVGRGWIELPGEILGGTLTTFALIVQFYFRRAPPKNGE